MPSRITVLISGRGSNLAALIDAARIGRLGGGAVVRVISNRPDAAGLARAAEAGIATTVVDHRKFVTRDAFDAALREAIDADRPDLVVLAGFMRVLGAPFVRHYEGRMINIHPSLLPEFAGLDTHRRALAAGVATHGCSVHFVSADVDGGPVVAQAAVPVLAGDDAGRLAARVLEEEHRLLPEVVRWFCTGRLVLADGVAQLDGVAIHAPIALPAASATAPPATGLRRRVRGVFWVALAASIAVHALWSLWPAPLPPRSTEPVLTATLETLPPPPAAVPAPKATPPAPAARPPLPEREPRRAAAPATTKPARASEPAPPPPAASAPRLLAAPRAPGETASAPGETASAPGETASAPASASTATNASAATNARAQAGNARSGDASNSTGAATDSIAVTLPPRVDLAYQVFLGTRGFMIGDATYRFEHDGDRYRISTVGEARGLAALFIHGTGKVESRGLITPTGLKPLEFAVERGSPDKREIAFFDWAGDTVSLNDGRTASLVAPAFDPLTVLWQPYFSPPTGATELTFSLATTRKVARYTLTREGDERLAWHDRTIDTERWYQVSADGKTEAWFWLAPSLHFIPIQMRATRTSRGTLEAKLASIRVDRQYAGFASDPGGPVPAPAPIEQRQSPFRDMTP
ncbi:MAG: phosphoribosylglycinamide formyltransferase [Proteobacteria bacterium]|nr:phosphoribosylglycinamide formyltransferase [Pseudomonadota bacterium]